MELYQRPNSPNWYARGKDGKGVWKNSSTGTDDETKAREIMGKWEIEGFFAVTKAGRPSGSGGTTANTPKLEPYIDEPIDPTNDLINESLGIKTEPTKLETKPEPETEEEKERKEKSRKRNESLCEILGQVGGTVLVGAAGWGYRQMGLIPAKPNPKHLKEFGEALTEQLKEMISDQEVKPWVKASLLYALIVASMGIQAKRDPKKDEDDSIPEVSYDTEKERKKTNEGNVNQ